MRIRSLLIKEFYQIIRDPSSIYLSFALPLILLFLYGYGISLDYKPLKIGLALEDHSPMAERFAFACKRSRYFDVTVVNDRRELDHPFMEGSIRGIVTIPSYFSSFALNGPFPGPIQLIADGSEPNTANFVRSYVQGAWNTWIIEEQKGKGGETPFPIELEPRFWFNEELKSQYFLVPGAIALILTLVGTLLTSLVIAREWELGTMESLMATPVRIEELIFAKWCAYFCLGMLSLFFSTFIAVWIIGVPLRGSILLLILSSSAYLFAALSIGLLISTLAKNQFIASQAALISAFLPAFILSGFLFEISSMPLWIQWFTYLIPAKYYVSCLQTLFLAGNVWPLILKNGAILLALGSLFFFCTARKTAKRLD